MNEQNKKTALISDFDNTLFFRNTEEQFKAQDIFEILFFQKRGGLFGICTGRSPDSILDTIGHFMHPDFIISVSGALIIDGKGTVLDKHCLDLATTEAIYNRFKDKALVVVHADGHVYALCKMEYPLQIQIESCDELPADRIYGISMRLPDEEAAAEAVQRIQEEFGDRAAAFQNLVNVDIVAAGCSKGTGAAKAKELFSIGKMGGIGDSFNDLPLIEAADVGFTFPTSPEALISAADHTVLSVSQAIETLEKEA
ncbi:MAG: HAD family phosphatase [Lachnospiraceae bacterium]|nr:HAD family phosphatase [Lachnospiraceae bacterium]